MTRSLCAPLIALAGLESIACGRIGFDPVETLVVDPSFGRDGVVVIDVGGVDNLGYSIQGVVVQPDGRIVVGGDAGTASNKDLLIARILDDGSFDASFGTNGVVTVDVFASDGVRSVALQPDGKIVAGGGGGSSVPNSAVIRLTSSGALDATFGNTPSPGVSVVTFAGALSSPNGAFVGGDGKIVFGGQGAGSTAGWDLVTARFDTSGVLDSTFGLGGTVATDVFGSDEFGTPHAILPDGRIYLVGQTYHQAVLFDGVVVRLAVDGALDPSFGTGGFTAIDFNASVEQADGLTIDPQGRLVVVGRTNEGPSADGFAIRLRADGSPDSTFAGGRGLMIDLGGQEELENTIVLPDGRIVAVGWSNHAGDYNFLVAVLRDDGTLDTSIGNGGIIELDVVAGQNDLGWGIARDSTGRILVFGATMGSTGQNDLALVRLVP